MLSFCRQQGMEVLHPDPWRNDNRNVHLPILLLSPLRVPQISPLQRPSSRSGSNSPWHSPQKQAKDLAHRGNSKRDWRLRTRESRCEAINSPNRKTSNEQILRREVQTPVLDMEDRIYEYVALRTSPSQPILIFNFSQPHLVLLGYNRHGLSPLQCLLTAVPPERRQECSPYAY